MKALALLVWICLAACNKGASASVDGGAATATKKVTRKSADIMATWKAEIDSKPMTEPMPKRVAAFLAKAGPPDKDSGKHKIYYAVDGVNCIKYDLNTEDGSFFNQGTDKSDCGM